jgi:hypothetical protein
MLPDLILGCIGSQKRVQSSLSKMSRQRAQQLASEFLARADATGWFETLYAEAENNYGGVS